MNKPVIIITGASSGIGAATARRLAREKVCLTLAARRTDRLKGVAEDVENFRQFKILLATARKPGPIVPRRVGLQRQADPIGMIHA